MLNITMLETRTGSEDGFALKSYSEGKTYDVGVLLAERFIRNGWAKHAAKEGAAA